MSRFRAKTACILASLTLALSMLPGCGPSGCSSSSNAGSTTQTATLTDATSIEAKLVSFDGSTLVIEFEGTQYTLDLSAATIKSTELHTGDTLIITYKGELKADDPSACTVLTVETKDDNDADVTEIVGTLEDITMNAITLRTIDGRVLTFNANNVKHTFSYGVDEGNWVTVIYHGHIVGTDTSNIAVVEIHDEDTDYVKSVKAQTKITDANETMYVLQDVKVHSSYMMASEVVGTLKAKDAVTCTGHCNNGWYRIAFNGGEAYVYGTLLTTNANEMNSKAGEAKVSQKVQIKALNETVYAKADANVREGYSTAAKSIGALKAGASVTRTGICDNGWSRITYNGRTAFVYSDLLTTTNPNSKVDGVNITAVNETIYVVKDANVRSAASENAEVIGNLAAGSKAVRTGICDNGWSRITYNKKDAFISSNLITKTDPNKNQKVTVYKSTGTAWTTTDCNVRESYSTDSKVLAQVKKGTAVTITGVTDNSWSRIDYNGKVAYIHNDLLTSTNPNPSSAASKKAEEEAKKKAEEAKKKEEEAKKAAEAEKKEEAAKKQTEEEKKKAEEAAKKKAEEEKKAAEEAAKKAEEEKKAAEEAQKKADEEAKKAAEEAQKEAAEAEEEAKKAAEAEKEADDQGTETEEEHEVDGIIVGYDLDSITIMVGDATAGTASASTEASSDDAYPSLTYDQAGGEVSSYYTFDISGASQEYSKGVVEGITVRVTYVGDLSDMENVRATRVTDIGVPQKAIEDEGADDEVDTDEGAEDVDQDEQTDDQGADKADQGEQADENEQAAEDQGTDENEQVDEDQGADEAEQPAEAEDKAEAEEKDKDEQADTTEAAPRLGTFRGVVISCTENTVTILVENNVKNTFSFDKAKVDKSKLLPGAEVKITADLTSTELRDNVLKATKIEITKEAPAASTESSEEASAEE